MSLCVASACLPAVALADSALVPVVLEDPIFKVIEAHRKSVVDYETCRVNEQRSEATIYRTRRNAALAELDAAWDRSEARAWELCRTPIFSLAGANALLRYAVEHVSAGHSWPDGAGDWNLSLHEHLASQLLRLKDTV